MNINDSSSNLFRFEKFCSTDEGFCLLKDEFEKMVLGPLKFEDLIFLENGNLRLKQLLPVEPKLSNKLVFKLIEYHLTAKACKKRMFGEDLDSLEGIYKRCSLFRPSVNYICCVFNLILCTTSLCVDRSIGHILTIIRKNQQQMMKCHAADKEEYLSEDFDPSPNFNCYTLPAKKLIWGWRSSCSCIVIKCSFF